ncbi:hypothetical protein P879_11530, partial [Paragonimus westermani]
FTGYLHRASYTVIDCLNLTSNGTCTPNALVLFQITPCSCRRLWLIHRRKARTVSKRMPFAYLIPITIHTTVHGKPMRSQQNFCCRTSSVLSEVRSSLRLNSKAVAKSNLKNANPDSCHLCDLSSHFQTNTTPFCPPAVLPPFSIPCARPVERVYSTRAPRRGVCLVLSIEKFHPALCLPARNGATVDLRNVCTAFSTLEFDVLTYTNLTASEMLAAIHKVADNDHSDSDCFACVVLTHGDENGIIYAYDRSVSLDQIILPFRGDHCASLRGKPKLFFIQVSIIILSLLDSLVCVK